MNNLIIKSINISESKGTIKKPVKKVDINKCGIVGDAHAGNWHRQISLLGTDSIDKFGKQLGRVISYGEFAENLSISGFDVNQVQVLDKITCGDLELEVTQIGKKCHGTGCSIYNESGNCVMPKEGIFCRVIRGGTLSTNDIMQYHHYSTKVLIITLSDRAAAGIYEDKSGIIVTDLVSDFMKEKKQRVKIERIILEDNSNKLADEIRKAIEAKFDLIFTTGGTGISLRDITVDTIKPMLEKEITGIMELIRVKYGMENPNALISRSIAGTIGQSLIYTLPGSPKAVKEYCYEIFKTIDHSLRMIHGIDNH